MARELPTTGWSRDRVLGELDQFRRADPALERTLLSIGINYGSAAVQELLKEAHGLFSHANAMVAFLRPGTEQMEKELSAITARLLGGGEDGIVTTMSSGGTESIFNAVHAMRERARAQRPEIVAPEIVAPFCAHAALSKACHYLDVTLRRVALGDDLRVDSEALERAVGPNTIGLYASAPCWPFGLYDPIDRMGEIAQRRDLWLHVDACLGGFVAPFAKKLGEPIPPWDFSVNGVTSISADLHKYGYAMKPASVTAWRSEKLLPYHQVLVQDWPAGPYVTQGFVGSRSAGPIAAAWAVMHHLGEDGYLRLTERMLLARNELYAGLRSIEGLRVLEPELCILCFDAGPYDTFSILGGMQQRGWVHFGTFAPPMIQLVLDPEALDHVDAYLADLRSVVSGISAGKTQPRGELHYAT